MMDESLIERRSLYIEIVIMIKLARLHWRETLLGTSADNGPLPHSVCEIHSFFVALLLQCTHTTS